MKWKLDSEILRKFETPNPMKVLTEIISQRQVFKVIRFLEICELISFEGYRKQKRGRPMQLFKITTMGKVFLDYMDYIEANIPEALKNEMS